MNTNKILISALVGAVVAFLLGWLIWGIALSGIMESHMGSATGVMRSDEEMLWIPMIIGHLCIGLLLAIIYGRWASISTFSTGMKAGAVIGFLFSMTGNMIQLGTTHIVTPTGAIIDVLGVIVSMGITGGVVGWWLGRD